MVFFEKHISNINSLCRAHKVKHLDAFGSVLKETFNAESDLDLVVDFEPMDLAQYADNYYAFKFSLEKIFKRNIDLLEEKAIKNPYFRKSLDVQKRSIYG